MPNTTRGFPYPSNSDDVDVAGDIGALATAVDNYVGGSVEGTSIKSTGGSTGQVLTASAGGGATWSAVSGGGNYNAPSVATAAFNQPTTVVAGTIVNIVSAANRGYCNPMNVGGNGTIAAVYDRSHTNYNGWSASLAYFNNVGGTMATGSLSQSSSGTSKVAGFGYGFDSAGTGFIIVEKTQTTSTQVQAWVKKYSGTATTNSWSTQILVNGSSNQGLYNGNEGPFYNNTVHYAPEIGAWIGGDYRLSTTSWNGTASMWLINDSSGTAYSVAFGTPASGSQAQTRHVFFIPAASGSAGTVHHWGWLNGTYFYSQYSVTPTSITEVMANNATAVFAGQTVSATASTNIPMYTYWNQRIGEGWGNWNGTFIRFDRTGGALSTVVTTHGTVNGFGDGQYGKGKERSQYVPEKGFLQLQTTVGVVLLGGTAGTAVNAFLQPDAPAYSLTSNIVTLGGGCAVIGTGNTWLQLSDYGEAANNTASQVYLRTVPGLAYATAVGTAAAAVEARLVAITASTGGNALVYQSPNTLQFGGTSIRLVPGTSSAVLAIGASSISTAAATATVTSFTIDLS